MEYEAVNGLDDMVCLSAKNDVLIPWCAKRIVKIAAARDLFDVVAHYSKYINYTPEMLSEAKEDRVAEAYVSLRDNSKLICGVGKDNTNGNDTKTVFVRSSELEKTSPSCSIGNTKNKAMLAVLIAHENGRIIENLTPIPVPGDENSITVPLTKSGSIYAGWEHADCFKPDDVEEDPLRCVSNYWLRQGVILAKLNDDTPRPETMRYRIQNDKKYEPGRSIAIITPLYDSPIYLDIRAFNDTELRSCLSVTFERDDSAFFLAPRSKHFNKIPALFNAKKYYEIMRKYDDTIDHINDMYRSDNNGEFVHHEERKELIELVEESRARELAEYGDGTIDERNLKILLNPMKRNLDEFLF